MKRLLVTLGTILFCSALSGCSGDPQSVAIANVIDKMREASGDIGSIAKEVETALKKQEKENKSLDLSAAITATTKLESTGKNLQKIKVEHINNLKPIDDDKKQELAKDFKQRINNAFTELVKEKANLNEQLQKASVNPENREKVEELRTKIREAEGPFETLARQG